MGTKAGLILDRMRKEFCISDTVIDHSHVEECMLEKIEQNFMNRRPQLEDIEDEIQKLFRNQKRQGELKRIHSYHSRIKESDHLIEKIIRKTSTVDKSGNKVNPGEYSQLDESNYYMLITDLIGVRILVRYRKDWRFVHDFLEKEFLKAKGGYLEKGQYLERYSKIGNNVMAEKPIAYKYVGDDTIFDGSKIHITAKDGYRSVHYLIRKNDYYVELQVRTLFQEAWGEVDHMARYPYKSEDPSLKMFSRVFSRVSGFADELGDEFFEAGNNMASIQPTINPPLKTTEKPVKRHSLFSKDSL
jgi:ppGpp synthetase/RelA/SpoT-type nucleotidyltranferase